MLEICAERVLCVGNTYFEHRSFHKQSGVTRGQDKEKVKGKIDLALVKKDMLRYVKDVREVGGMERGLSDNHAVLCKLRLGRTWIREERWWLGLG